MSFENDEHLAGQAIEAGAYDEAVRLLRPLAERNSEYALLTLGWIYETGATGTTDKAAARSLYEDAVARGSATAYLYLGWLHLKEGRELEARAAFEEGAKQGNEECKSALESLSDNADEKAAALALADEDFEEALRLLRPLADRNSEYALLCLGYIYETGTIGSPDNDAARSCYKRAAAQGRGPAQYELGRFLSSQGDELEARAAYKAGAEQGHLPSMSKLGTMMIEGRGGPSNPAEGWAWLEKAASQGHVWAQRELLAIEDASAQSLSKKLSVKMRIARLALKGARELAKDPRSDKVR
jgi:TPR repeat protein